MKRILTLVALCATLGWALPASSQDKAAPDAKPATEATATEAKPAEAAAPAAAPMAATAAPEAKKDEAKPAAPPAPVPNKGDTAWMLTATVLVILMTIPGLALFYGGMVRAKNMLSILMQVFATFALLTVLWFIYGYSVAFTGGGSFFGGFDKLFLKGITDASTAATFSKGVVIPELVFVVFQCTFAAITPCLILGAFAERMKFSAVLLFMVIWFTFSYLPIAHIVLYWDGPDAITNEETLKKVTEAAGFLWAKGAIDFAGGTVVHINAGIAGLVGAYLIGKRVGFGKEAMTPHSLTMTMIGASMLWVGWFGFNVGSNLEANGTAGLAFANTFVATAAATVSWMLFEWMFKGKPSMLGAASVIASGPSQYHTMWASGRYENVNQITMNSSTALNFMRSANAPRIRQGVIAANVHWNATNANSGITTPLLKVAAVDASVMPFRKSLSKPPKNELPPVNATL